MPKVPTAMPRAIVDDDAVRRYNYGLSSTETRVKPYPLMMNLENKPVVVVGGGRVAERKIRGLLDCGARVVVISPEVVPHVAAMAETGTVELINEAFRPDHLDMDVPPSLVFGTTDDREVNVATYEAAVERGIPCNIADVPDLCTFFVPAIVRQGDLMISIGTGGASPALSRRIREELEGRFGPEYDLMTRVMAELRKHVLALGKEADENKHTFMRVVDSEMLEALRDEDEERAIAILAEVVGDSLDASTVVRSAFTGFRGGSRTEWT